MSAILEVRNLTHTYSAGTPFEHKALDNVSFTVQRGEFIGIIGHTGSGKSTLMQHLNGLLKATSGEILLDGVNIFKDKATTRQARFRVGLVFQYPEYQLFEETVYKDIDAIQQDFARGGLQQTVQVLHQGRLAGTGVADDAHKLAPLHRKGHFVQRLMLKGGTGRISMSEAFHLKNGRQITFLPARQAFSTS